MKNKFVRPVLKYYNRFLWCSPILVNTIFVSCFNLEISLRILIVNMIFKSENYSKYISIQTENKSKIYFYASAWDNASVNIYIFLCRVMYIHPFI